MKNLDVYLINLDRSPERLSAMQEKLSKLGLKFKRISAVDGKKTEFTKKQINSKKYSLLHGKYITPTEVACYISHYNTMVEFLKSKNDFALVLEDDMIFSEKFMDILDALLKKSNDWDLVKLNGGHSGGNVKYRSILPNVNLVWNLFHQSKTGAYLMNKKAAKSYVKKMLPMFVPIDHEYIKFWKYGIRGFSVSPFPSWEEDGPSTIDYKMVKKNRKPWYKKFPTFGYKIFIALRRIVWVLFQVLKNTFTFIKK
ncbi:MAG: glycosyltransferase family 25 protein [Alphaproteobacteria bacterium]|nr:glycosyltransferase family 25 protein [Alphaproteobacteria bacterium]